MPVMDAVPDLPIPISMIGGQYLLFSIDTITYLRREHHICGVLIGSIPQVPQQNVFLGVPLELMPEEAQLLVEERLAYIVDDAMAHRQGLVNVSPQKRRQYLKKLRDAGRRAAVSQAESKEQARAKFLSKSRSKVTKGPPVKLMSQDDDDASSTTENAQEESLFAPPSPSEPAPSESFSISTFGITPASSRSLLTPLPSPFSRGDNLPTVPGSYPLFKHLHSKGYFPSPGLRFGCQYLVYPGDPLRFHSHFLASHVDWDEELDLVDIVGGGRLGTGVKKGYLIGGLEKKKQEEVNEESTETVRTFSIEWASM
jgi:tRNA-splicing endonuclease subunit Sen34